jgi:hypothetical protein
MSDKKTIFIKQQFDALASSKTWDVTINNIDFIPSILTVRQVSYVYTGALENVLFLVTANLIKDPYLCAISDNGSVSPHSVFSLGSNISGTYRFQAQLITGAIPTNQIQGSLVIILEFSK